MLFTGILFLVIPVFAQENVVYEDDVPILLRKEASAGVTFHTGGMGIIFRRGMHVTGTRKRMWETEAVTMRHPKEHKTHYYDESKPFVYGKLNYLLLLRSGIGYQNVLYRKGDRKGVEIRSHYMAGFSAGITKPVYLYIIQSNHGAPNELPPKEVEQYNPEKHQLSDIYGKAEFSYGLDKLGLHPGGYAKAAFSFEYGKSDNNIRSVEVGASLDLFPKAIPLMAYPLKNSIINYHQNKPYYVSLYLSFFMGGKW